MCSSGIRTPASYEKHGDLAGAADAAVTPHVCSATILSGDMLEIQDLVRVVGVEGPVAYVALYFLVNVVGQTIFALQTLLVIEDCHRLCLQAPQLTYQPLPTILPHPGLIPYIELAVG